MFLKARRLTHRQCLTVGVGAIALGAVIRTLAVDVSGVNAGYSFVTPFVLLAALIGGFRAGVAASVTGLALTILALRAGYIPSDGFADAERILILEVLGCIIAVGAGEGVLALVRRGQAAQERLRAALHATGVGTWRWDTAKDTLHWDDSVLATYGIAREAAPRSIAQFLDLVDPRDRVLVRDSLEAVRRTGQDGKMEFRVRAADGSLRWIYDRHTLIRESDARASYVIGASLDATAHKRAEEQNAHLAAVVSSSGDAIFTFSLDGTIMSWNGGAENLFGYCAAEAIGADVTMLSTPGTKEIIRQMTPRVIRGETVSFTGTRIRKDGTEFVAEVTSAPIRNAAGRTIAISSLARDVSQRIAMDQQKELLIRELHHRVRNTLATVQGIVSASLRFSQSEDVGEAIAQRIQALARTHAILTEHRDQAADLDQLILLEVAPYRGDEAPRVILDGPDVTLGSAVAVPLSMAIHELVTNATKYGSLSRPEGRVHLSWSMIELEAGEVGLLIDWRESGGPPVEPPASEGFGSTLLRRVLGSQLHAQVAWDFAPEGVHVEIRLPMPGFRVRETIATEEEAVRPL